MIDGFGLILIDTFKTFYSCAKCGALLATEASALAHKEWHQVLEERAEEITQFRFEEFRRKIQEDSNWEIH